MNSLPPQFVGIVETVRDSYVEQFTAAVAGFSEDTHVVEPALLDAEGEIAVDGPLDLPYRADFAELKTGELLMFHPEKAVKFEAFSFSLGGTQIDIAPFRWDNAVIRVTGDWDDTTSALFTDWFRRSFGEDDATDNLQIQNVVHFASDPDLTDTGYSFDADFGTAPASALSDLLLALLGNAPERIEIATAVD